MYNIHYLATSNIAEPLKMMESLVEQLWWVVNTLFYCMVG